MTNAAIDLQALSSKRGLPSGPAIHPPRRWISRVVLPLLLLIGFGGLALFAAWDYLVPATPVTVAPVAVRQEFVETGGVELVKAVGWVEPSPRPIEVGSLVEGVIDKLHVLEGQRLNSGDLIAELIDADAKLAVDAAQADLAERKLKVESAQQDIAEADAQRKVVEAQERLEAKLLKDNVISEERYSLAKAQLDVAQARVAQARSRKEEAQAAVRRAEIALDVARLQLERTNVRTPYSGVVLKVHTVAGRMVGQKSVSAEHFESLIELYDPMKLQVRVEVPLDKFRHVRPLQPAIVEVDALPGKRLAGMVLYDTQQADITRNTVQVKVAILRVNRENLPLLPALPAPDPLGNALYEGIFAALSECHKPQDVLRPGMIASVRIFSPTEPHQPGAQATGGEALRIFIPRKLILQEDGQPSVWIVDQLTSRAVKKSIATGRDTGGEWVEVVEGLQPSDKLIVSGRDQLKPNERVRITAEETDGAPTSGQ